MENNTSLYFAKVNSGKCYFPDYEAIHKIK